MIFSVASRYQARRARLGELFAVVSLEETGESGAAAGFVFRHFVNRVVDGVETELLRIFYLERRIANDA